MADNVSITPGAGATVACDELTDGVLGSVKVQYVKLMDGTLDGSTKATVGANGLSVDVKAMPVVHVDDNSGSLTVDGNLTTVSTVSTITNVVHVDDNSGSLTVDNSTISVVGSGTEANAQRVTIATDSTGVLSVDDNGSSLTIDNSTLSIVSGGHESGSLRVTIADDSSGILSVDDNGASLTIDNPILSVVGGGTESSAQRVTIANDSTGVLSIDDNNGSLTVDNAGTFATQAAQSGTWTVQVGNTPNSTPILASVHDGTTKATVRELGANDALNVAIVDGSGNHVTSFGGGTQYAEDTAHVSGDSVTLAGVVQQAADAALSTDGDRSLLQVDANGFLKVNIKAGAGSGGTASTDDAAFTAGASSGTPMMGYYTSDSVDSGDVGVVKMLANRQLAVTLYNSAGTEVGVGGGTQYAEDAASADGASMTLAGTIRQDSPGGTTSTDGDYQNLKTDSVGRLWVNASGAAVPITDNSGSLTVDGSLTTVSTVSTITNVVHVDDNASSLTVDGTVAVSSITAGDNNIGNVDIVTVPAPLSITGAGTEAAALRVTIANDSTGVVSIDDNAGSLTVDGAVTVTNATAANLKAEVVGTGTFVTQATLAAETTKVIGTINVAASQTIAVTQSTAANLNATVAQATAANLNATVVQATAANLNATVVGSVAHDGVDSGNPQKIGARAIAHGTNPTAVAAADRTDLYANRAGVQFVIGGHPNIVTIEAAYTAAQTDTAIVTIAGGLKIVVTSIAATCDNANTVDVGIRVGFGTANTPTTTGVVLTHPGIAPGSGVVLGNGAGMLGVGADGEDLRVTCEVPTTGSIRVLVTYFTIES
jgi:hypothetical protein